MTTPCPKHPSSRPGHAGPAASRAAWHFRPFSFQGRAGWGERWAPCYERAPTAGERSSARLPENSSLRPRQLPPPGPPHPGLCGQGRRLSGRGAGRRWAPAWRRCPRGLPVLEQAALQMLRARARGRELRARALRRAHEATAHGTAESSAAKTTAGIGGSRAVLPRAITGTRGRRGRAGLNTGGTQWELGLDSASQDAAQSTRTAESQQRASSAAE